MSALLTVKGVKDKTVTIGLPLPYCRGDGVFGDLTPTDKARGLDVILNFPDGVGFLNSVKYMDSGFLVDIQGKR